MDPTRLRDDASQPAELRELIERSIDDVGSKDEVAKLALKLGAMGIGAAGLTAASAAKASVLGKVGAWVVAAAVVGGGAIAIQQRTSAPPDPVRELAPVSSQVTPVPAAPPIEVPATPTGSPTSLAAPALPPHSRATPQPPRAPVQASTSASSPSPVVHEPPPAVSQLSESQVLAAAQTALPSNPARALELTAEHRRRFPTGALSQERQVLEIDALYRLGRRAEADQRAQRFIASHPGSSYARRVRELGVRK